MPFVFLWPYKVTLSRLYLIIIQYIKYYYLFKFQSEACICSSIYLQIYLLAIPGSCIDALSLMRKLTCEPTVHRVCLCASWDGCLSYFSNTKIRKRTCVSILPASYVDVYSTFPLQIGGTKQRIVFLFPSRGRRGSKGHGRKAQYPSALRTFFVVEIKHNRMFIRRMYGTVWRL